MNPFSVEWLSDILQTLADIWLQAPDRQAVTAAQARADQEETGPEGNDPRRGVDEREQEADARQRGHEARDDQRPLRTPLGEPLLRERSAEDADRGRREDETGLDGVVAPDLLQEDRDDERRPQQEQPLDVLRHEGEVAHAVLEELTREQRRVRRQRL